MDPHNDDKFIDPKAEAYWQNVDLYIGGSEHATGHLLYSRFWNKFLKDRGFINQEEPFKKLINQGMILGTSEMIHMAYRTHPSFKGSEEEWDKLLKVPELSNIFVSADAIDDFMKEHPQYGYPLQQHVDINVTKNSELNISEFIKWRPEYANYQLYCKGGFWIDGVFVREKEGSDVFKTTPLVEKMSKSKWNVQTPDDICEQYGADALRLFEMFLGPLEQSKPWNITGISGVTGFLKKLWRLYFDETGLIVNSNPASKEALKTLHKTIKKVQEDIENFSFNTSVSSFMIAVNELTAMNCHERSILEPLAVIISPYAPHIAEELWHRLGHQESISTVPFPRFNPEYLVESSKEYPVSFNGKTRFTIELPTDMSVPDIEKTTLADERTQQQLGGNAPKKVIVVPGRIINIVA